MKVISILLLLLSISMAADLNLSISGIKPEQGGNLLIFLYKESTWMKLKVPTKRIPVTVDLKTFSINLVEIPEGEYAVQVVHDRDRNGKLTMKWTPPGPVEGYGFSAGYKPTGIPKYKPASVEIKSDTSLTIGMSYPK